jgi:hypothetical protein
MTTLSLPFKKKTAHADVSFYANFACFYIFAVCQEGCWNMKHLHRLEPLPLFRHQALSQEGTIASIFMS